MDEENNIIFRLKQCAPQNIHTLSLTPLTEIKFGSFTNFSQLRELNLSGNDIHTINFDSFNGLTELIILKLSNCNINKLESHISISLPKLEILDLSNNPLVLINKEIFRGDNQLNLKQLMLKNCNINRISSRTFKTLNNLELLDLSKNPISEIRPGMFYGLIKLNTLLLNNCNISMLYDTCFVDPHGFTNNYLKNLKNLDLSGNKISFESCDSITEYMFYGIKELEVLNLSNNNIDIFCVSDFLVYLPNLDLLIMSGNPINEIYIEDITNTNLHIKTKFLVNDCHFSKDLEMANEELSYQTLFNIVNTLKQKNNKIKEQISNMQEMFEYKNPIKPNSEHRSNKPPLPWLRGRQYKKLGGYYDKYLKYKQKCDSLLGHVNINDK